MNVFGEYVHPVVDGYPKKHVSQNLDKNWEFYQVDLHWLSIAGYSGIDYQFHEDFELGSILFHREDGPARYYNDIKEWRYYGKYHRFGLPAVISGDNIWWYIHGEYFDCTKSFCMKSNFDDETTMFWLLRYGEFLPLFREELGDLVID